MKEKINKEMQNINSLNDLIEYFLQKEKIEREKFRLTRDIFGIGKNIAKKVDTILSKIFSVSGQKMGFQGRKFFASEPTGLIPPPKAAVFTADGASPRLRNFSV